MKQTFWQGKKVLITGNTGFKGSWLSLWLTKLGAEVAGYSLQPNTDPNLFNLLGLEKRYPTTYGDIRDTECLKTAMNDHQPDIVLHLAAQALVRPSYADPVTTFSTNIMGTVSVLEAVRQQESVKVFINVTSDKCYDNKEWIWPYRESDSMGGYDPYSASKGCSELVTSAYINSFFSAREITIASARAGNVVGGGDWSVDRLVPDILGALSESRDIVLRNPHAIRPWQHVLEPIAGYILLAEALWDNKDLSGGWNFGPSYSGEMTVNDLAFKMVSFWGGDQTHVLHDTGETFHEASILRLDSTKARSMLNWKSRLSTDETIAWIVEWTRAFHREENMLRVTLEQIEKYEKLSAHS
ncbi:CDP-glucose 4,6-dehydratase [Paenibacillus sp. LMG 31461]|uniref:CDP-glucose 4,6-dehydratase n=1 Tax=Paenibacillus plantarum TaxID=2654975 RepID=A0ABX1XE46_9BACL|nr:CDP-glucose 4,6-dehydratase [Paenibacillus plantarum]